MPLIVMFLVLLIFFSLRPKYSPKGLSLKKARQIAENAIKTSTPPDKHKQI